MAADEEAAEEHKTAPNLWFLRRYVDKPRMVYGMACGAHCFFFVLFMILVAALGPAFFPFYGEVPFSILDDVRQERQDAVTQGKLKAHNSIGSLPKQLQRTAYKDGRNLEFVLDVIYIAESGENDLLSQQNLNKIKEIESKIVGHPDYNKWCELDWTRAESTFQVPTGKGYTSVDGLRTYVEGSTYTIADYCGSANTAANPNEGAEITNVSEAVVVQRNNDVPLNFCNTEFAENQRVPCRPPASLINACDGAVHPNASRQYITDCTSIESWPYGLFKCPTAGASCTLDQGVPLSPAELNSKIRSYSAYATYTYGSTAYDQAVNFVYGSADKSFGGQTLTSKAIRSTFYFGAPIAGKNSIKDPDDFEDQTKEIGDFIFKAYNDDLMDANVDSVQIWFSGYKMDSAFTLRQLGLDGSFALMSIIFVLFFMSYMTSSWFKAFMGMAQILSAFPIGYFIYFGVMQQRYFGVFNLLTIFIILGVGADDVFVFLDTFKQSGMAEFGVKDDLWSRLSWTWRRAGKAMLVTSITTMASFLTNATSSFAGIRTFGIYAAMLVLVNYCSVIFYYPSVVAYYEKVLTKPGHPACCFGGAYCCGVGHALHATWDRLETVFAGAHRKRVDGPGSATIEQWFANTYAPFIAKKKYWILSFFTVLIIVACLLTSQVGPDPQQPRFYPEWHNYGGMGDQVAKYFSRGGSVFALTLEAAWAIRADKPIDRSGTFDTDVNDLGKTQYDDGYAFVRAMPCQLQMCDAMATPNPDVYIGGEPEYQVNCFTRAYYKWFAESNPGSEWEWFLHSGVDNCAADDTWQRLGSCWAWHLPHLSAFLNADHVSGASNRDFYDPYIKADNCPTGTTPLTPNGGCQLGVVPRLNYAEVVLTLDFIGIEFKTGQEAWAKVETWFNSLGTTGNCTGEAGLSGVNPGFFNGNMWAYFWTQERLMQEMTTGIILSLILALVVLVLATGNAIVGSLAVFCIGLIVLCIFAFTVLMDWKLGLLECIVLVMVPGMSVDYVAHLAEAYSESHHRERIPRMQTMLQEVGVSVVSGALSTLGAAFFLFFPVIQFFVKFGIYIFATIFFSLIFALIFFPMALSMIGPEGDSADIHKVFERFTGKQIRKPSMPHLPYPGELFRKSRTAPVAATGEGQL